MITKDSTPLDIAIEEQKTRKAIRSLAEFKRDALWARVVEKLAGESAVWLRVQIKYPRRWPFCSYMTVSERDVLIDANKQVQMECSSTTIGYKQLPRDDEQQILLYVLGELPFDKPVELFQRY